MEINAPKGTHDVTPAESYKWHYIENAMRAIAAAFGFAEIRTPVFEHTELFLRGVGDTTDIVQKEMYTFLDKGERSITLKPEGTAGVARSFIESRMAYGAQPNKMYYLNCPVFRYEAPQSGRFREHHQFGIETFGTSEASADAETIALAWTLLGRLGVHSLKLNINSIGCPKCRPGYNAALREYFGAHASEMCETCRSRLDKNPLRILDCKEARCQPFTKAAPTILEHLCEECSVHFDALKKYLGLMDIEYAVNPFIVRGLDYYTKTVFEIVSESIGSQGTVCGGGRYDGLIAQLGGPEMGGVGFGMGMERLLMVMEKQGGLFPDAPAPDVFICAIGEAAYDAGYALCQRLRAQGVCAEIDHMRRGVKAQFKHADRLRCRTVAVLGDDELAKGVVRLKTMQTGEEKDVPMEALHSAVCAEI